MSDASETGDGEALALEELLRAGEVLQALPSLDGGMDASGQACEAARAGYERLQAAAERSLVAVATLQARIAELQGRLERSSLEQEVATLCQEGGLNDAVQVLDRYREAREQARAEAALRQDEEEAARGEVEALQARVAEMNAGLVDAEDDRRAELAPELRAVREEVEGLAGQLAGERAKTAAAQREAAETAARLEALQLEIEALQVLRVEEAEELARAERQPAHARHAADLAAAALRALRDEEVEQHDRLRGQEAAATGAEAAAREAVAAQLAEAKAGARLQTQIGARERALDEVQRDIDITCLETEKLLADQVTLDLEVEKRKGEAKRAADTCRAEHRGRDTALRRLNKAQMEGEQLAGQLAPLENAAAAMRGQLAAAQRQGVREAEASARLQGEVLAMVGEVAAEKRLTAAQEALVKASLEAVRELDVECAAARRLAAQRDRLAADCASQRDAAARFASGRTARLREAVEAAEVREGEVEELGRRRAELKAARGELRGLAQLMSGQSGRLQLLLGAVRKRAADLADEVAAAEAQERRLAAAAGGKAVELRRAERACAAAEAGKTLAANRLAMERRGAAAVAERFDDAAIEAARLARAAADAGGALDALRRSAAAAAAAKRRAAGALLERDEELCGLYERSGRLEGQLAEGAAALARCEDEMRVLGLEAAELQRRLFASHKTAPDVPRYDRSVARLKAELLQARREAEALGAELESPKASLERWRLLPGRLPPAAELEGRLAQLEERLEQRRSQAAQKDQVLEELAALAEALVAQARASHGGAFDIGKLTRRMMAAVSELSLYSAMSLKCAAERDTLRGALEAARRNVAAGAPPTADADREYERQQRDRAAQAEVRAQAAELRALCDAGLLGGGAPGPSPRPLAYVSEAAGVPVPFPAAFPPFKPSPPKFGGGAGGGRGGRGSGDAGDPGAAGASRPGSGQRAAASP
eukprot:scaffold12.g7989.t1